MNLKKREFSDIDIHYKFSLNQQQFTCTEAYYILLVSIETHDCLQQGCAPIEKVIE